MATAVQEAAGALAWDPPPALRDWAFSYRPSRRERRWLAASRVPTQHSAVLTAVGLAALPRWSDKLAYDRATGAVPRCDGPCSGPSGSATGRIANALGKPVSNLAPALGRLVDAGFVVRFEDPARAQRPLYDLADPFQARSFLGRFAALDLLGDGVHVGPAQVSVAGVERQLDVVVTGAGEVPAERRLLALGEAKAGEVLDVGHLRRLEEARAAYGPRAAGATMWLFGPTVDPELARIAASRSDVEVVDLARLYHGS